METYNDPLSDSIIGWIAERHSVDDIWFLRQVIELIKETRAINPYMPIQIYHIEQKKFIDKYFDKRVYFHLKPEVQIRVLARQDPDPIWIEHLLLTEDIKGNLYSTPFMIKCDDKDFLIGALEAALAEVKEPNWFDWYVELILEGDDEGDYYEIKRFEEES